MAEQHKHRLKLLGVFIHMYLFRCRDCGFKHVEPKHNVREAMLRRRNGAS